MEQGDDTITAGNGADTITAGSGDDTITLTEDAQSTDDVLISNGGSADAATQATTAGGDDTGADTITGFDAGASADEITTVTATGVTNFVHADDVVFGTGTASATSTGIIADFSTSALIFDFNGDGDAKDDGVDLVINMNSLKIDGVAVTSDTRATALTNIKADIAYDITGSAAGDTITTAGENDTIAGGDGADTINGGLGDDQITGGAGADAITLGGGTDTVVFSSATSTNGSDTIGAFNTGDTLDFSGVLTSGSVTNASGTAGVITQATPTALATEATSIAVAANEIYVAEVALEAGIDTAAEIVTALANTGVLDAVDVATSATAILVVGGADDDTTHYIYGIVNDATAAVGSGGGNTTGYSHDRHHKRSCRVADKQLWLLKYRCKTKGPHMRPFFLYSLQRRKNRRGQKRKCESRKQN